MRDARTYRSERRNDWHKLRGVTWFEHNWRDPHERHEYQIGSKMIEDVIRTPDRSKYMPHNGKREMERRVTQLDALIDRYTTSIMANVEVIANDEAA